MQVEQWRLKLSKLYGSNSNSPDIALLVITTFPFNSCHLWCHPVTNIIINQHITFDGMFPITHTHARACTHTHTHPFNGPFPGLPGSAGTRKVEPFWILMKQETVSGSGISWAMCKSAPHSRQITMPAHHRSVFFTGQMPNQQRRNTEGLPITECFLLQT